MRWAWLLAAVACASGQTVRVRIARRLDTERGEPSLAGWRPNGAPIAAEMLRGRR